MTTEKFPHLTMQPGGLGQLDELLLHLDASKLFFVVDAPAYKFSGAEASLEKILGSREVTWFSDFELNPKIEDAQKGISAFRKAKPDVVVAIGGGSALDMAKLIAGCGVQDGEPIDYIKKTRTLERNGPPVIAIPTTSGTGSEATRFAVVYVDGKKYSLAHDNLLPDYVIIDPALTESLPAGATANCGLDALCQSIESIWSVGATDESVGYAIEAVSLAERNLEDAVSRPNPEVRAAMAKAAHLSGMAINITKTTAPHAFSYAVTTRYKVPHGAAVALTFPVFLEFNFGLDATNCVDPRGPEAVKERIQKVLDLIGDGSLEKTMLRLNTIIQNVGCPVRLNQVGIQEADFPSLIGAMDVERLSNNPRRISAQELSAMLDKIL